MCMKKITNYQQDILGANFYIWLHSLLIGNAFFNYGSFFSELQGQICVGKILNIFYFRGKFDFWGHFFQFGAILRLGNLKALFWGQIFLFRGIFKIYEEAVFF